MGASAVFYAMLINCISEKNACFSCYRENLSAVLLETVLFCCVLMFFLVCFWLLLYAFNVHPFSPSSKFFFFFAECTCFLCIAASLFVLFFASLPLDRRSICDLGPFFFFSLQHIFLPFASKLFLRASCWAGLTWVPTPSCRASRTNCCALQKMAKLR